MSDKNPLDQLHNFDLGGHVNPLPPADVRRRGDRIRRRNNAFAAVGAAAAVALIATPLALIAGNDDNRPSPAPAPPSPSQTVTNDSEIGEPALVTIPEGFDLTSTMFPDATEGEPEASKDATGLTQIEYCSKPLFAKGSEVDRLAANSSAESEGGDARELRVYNSNAEASAELDRIRSQADACETEQFTTTTWIHSAAPATLGEESYLLTTTYEDSGLAVPGADIQYAARVGNAVVLSVVSGEFFDTAIQEGADASATALQPVIDQMCVFSAEGCGEDSGEGDGSATGSNEQLLRLEDLPERENFEPYVTLDPGAEALLACQPQGGIEELGAEQSVRTDFSAMYDGATENIPGSVIRTAVLDFADDTAAQDAYQTVSGWFENCPGMPDAFDSDDGGPLDLGDEGTQVAYNYGAPDICKDCDAGRFSRQAVVRVGSQLVLFSLADVGGPLEPPGLKKTMVQLMTVATDRLSN